MLTNGAWRPIADKLFLRFDLHLRFVHLEYRCVKANEIGWTIGDVMLCGISWLGDRRKC